MWGLLDGGEAPPYSSSNWSGLTFMFASTYCLVWNRLSPHLSKRVVRVTQNLQNN